MVLSLAINGELNLIQFFLNAGARVPASRSTFYSAAHPKTAIRQRYGLVSDLQ